MNYSSITEETAHQMRYQKVEHLTYPHPERYQMVATLVHLRPHVEPQATTTPQRSLPPPPPSIWCSQGIESCGFKSHGGTDAPYVYVDLEGKASWDVFSEILEKAQVRFNSCGGGAGAANAGGIVVHRSSPPFRPSCP